MNTVPVQEIKRRGISAVDKALREGPVHVIKNNAPAYVILTEDRYADLLNAENEAHIARVKASLEAAAKGDVKRFDDSAALLAAIEQEDE